MTPNDFFDFLVLSTNPQGELTHLKYEISYGEEPYCSIAFPYFNNEEVNSMIFAMEESEELEYADVELDAENIPNWFANIMLSKMESLESLFVVLGELQSGYFGSEIDFLLDKSGCCRMELGIRPEEFGEEYL